jgi:hypothetical protein
MQVIHFTPGSLVPRGIGRREFAAALPPVDGEGSFELSALYLAPMRQIIRSPVEHGHLPVIVNGRADANRALRAACPSSRRASDSCSRRLKAVTFSTNTGAGLLSIDKRSRDGDGTTDNL